MASQVPLFFETPKTSKPEVLQETLILRDVGFIGGPGYATLYTVPPHTRFYLWGYDVNCYAINIALPLWGGFFILDGLGQHNLAELQGPAGTLALHTQNSFNLLQLEAGASFVAFADANVQIRMSMYGLEVIHGPI